MAVSVMAGVHASAAMATTNYTVLHVFCRSFECADGNASSASMVMDAAGNLYGTANDGIHRAGLVFELSPPQAGETKWSYRVLYNFCSRTACRDGDDPTASILIRDTAGNLYGTTARGGSTDSGTAFMLSPENGGKRWRSQVIYDFCSHRQSCSDGIAPLGGLTYPGAQSGAPYDGVSPLYGEAQQGGRQFAGTVFEIQPGGQKSWSETTRYAFCAENTCSDGQNPGGGLSFDAAGNLYGLTSRGGAANAGIVFKLTPQEGVKRWPQSVLHSFCSGGNCSDGVAAFARPLIDASGNLFGTTEMGGTAANGILYEIAADGTFGVLHNFCSDRKCTDGVFPVNYGGLVMDSAGNIFGVTEGGGGKGSQGTIFEWSASSLERLYRFGVGKRAGVFPVGGLIIDGSGNLFGTTENGTKGPTAFELSR
jgi:uncharacterized repeat protein (TIGR03803 family)